MRIDSIGATVTSRRNGSQPSADPVSATAPPMEWASPKYGSGIIGTSTVSVIALRSRR